MPTSHGANFVIRASLGKLWASISILRKQYFRFMRFPERFQHSFLPYTQRIHPNPKNARNEGSYNNLSHFWMLCGHTCPCCRKIRTAFFQCVAPDVPNIDQFRASQTMWDWLGRLKVHQAGLGMNSKYSPTV